MIKSNEFEKEELQGIVTTLADFKERDDHLNQQVQKIFEDFDKDKNGYLDRKELRQFLTFFFKQYKMHFPVTDEYVDAVFREIDQNRDNKIQPNELQQYASHFVNQLLPEYQKALGEK